jgi:hypothetical protein
MTNEKSFDMLDCVHGHINHRHSCVQQIVSWGNMLVQPFDVVIRGGHLAECGSGAMWHHNAVKSMPIMHNLLKSERWNNTN